MKINVSVFFHCSSLSILGYKEKMLVKEKNLRKERIEKRKKKDYYLPSFIGS